MKTRFGLAALALAGTLAIAGCSGGAGASGGSGGEGGNGGTVVWYSSHNTEQNDAVVDAFREAHPDVHVEVLRLVTGELSVRYAQERSSDVASADVITIADKQLIDEGHDKDWWVEDAVPAEGWPAEALGRGVATVGILPLLLGYNTELVDGADVPTGWEDLLEPSYKDQIMLTDPRSVPAYLALAQIWRDEYGDEFLSDLAAQNPQIVASIVPGNETLGAGGGKILVPNAAPAASTVINAGAPIKLLGLAPTTGSEYLTAMTSNAANPDAAAVFFEFLTSKEGQEAFNGTVIVSVRDDTEGTVALPEGYIPLDDVLPEAQKNRAELLALLGIE